MPKPKRVKIDCDDLNSGHGANLVRNVIRAFWHGRGFLSVQVDAYPLGPALPGKYGVRSNLVNGLPPSHLALR